MQTAIVLVAMGQRLVQREQNIRVSRMEYRNLTFPCASSATTNHLCSPHLVPNLHILSVSQSPLRSS